MSELNELFEKMQVALTKDLLARIEAGTATAAELNVARQLLKDNGIDSVPTKDNGLEGLSKILPFDPDSLKK